jgi:hypothetical protein
MRSRTAPDRHRARPESFLIHMYERMNLVVAVGAVFAAVVFGSHRQVDRAASELDERRARSALLDQWTLVDNNIH